MTSIIVVVPTVDSGELFKKSIISIVNQTIPVNGIIVVHDVLVGEGLSEYNEKYNRISQYLAQVLHNRNIEYKLIKTNVNLGASGARNKALDCGLKCDYIAFLDADDTWESKHIENFINFSDDYLNENILYFDMYNEIRMPHSILSLKSILFSPKLHTPCAIVSYSSSLRFPKISHSEDIALWFDLLSRGYKVVCNNVPGAKGRAERFSGGLSGDVIKMSKYKIIIMISKFYKKMPLVTMLAVIYELIKIPTRYFRAK